MTPEEIPLGDVPLDALTCFKELRRWRDGADHSRWIFLSPPGPGERLVWKLWNPGYVRRETIRQGFASGLYTPEVVPAFRALVTHRGLCRGYAMRLGDKLRAPPGRLVRALWENTRRSGHFALQYNRSHTIDTPDGASLIDLEAVHPLPERDAFRARGISIEDRDYDRLVAALSRGPLDAAAVAEMAEAHLRALDRPRHPSPRREIAWLRRKAQGMRRRAERSAVRMLGDRRDEIDRL